MRPSFMAYGGGPEHLPPPAQHERFDLRGYVAVPHAAHLGNLLSPYLYGVEWLGYIPTATG